MGWRGWRGQKGGIWNTFSNKDFKRKSVGTNVKHKLFIECQFFHIIIAKLTFSDGMPCANRHLHAALHSCSRQPHGAARGRAGICIQIFTNLETTLRTSAISVSFAINWQVDTDYYPTLTELTLASKLLQIGRYIFFLIL